MRANTHPVSPRRNSHAGAALVEFSIILLPLTWLVIGATDIALYILARQQVSAMSLAATHYAAHSGVDTPDFNLVVERAIANPFVEGGTIRLTDTVRNPISVPAALCGCSATQATSANPCFDATEPDYACPLTYDGTNFSGGQGTYVTLTASADYPVLVPAFWQVVMGQPLDGGRMGISITSVVRIK